MEVEEEEEDDCRDERSCKEWQMAPGTVQESKLYEERMMQNDGIRQ